MPSRSSAISSDSASTPSKLMFVVLGDAARRVAVDVRAGHAGEDAVARADRAARRGAASAASRAGRSSRRDAEAGDRRDVLGAGAPVALLPAAGHLRHEPRAAANPQRAGALRAAELVAGERQQVDAERAGRRPAACRPSARRRCGRARRARVAIAARSAIGWIVPISLLACITETSAVSAVIAAAQRLRRDRRRSPSRAASVTVQPRRASALAVCSTASCSMPLVTRCRRPRGSSASATPRRARLSASVPPAVKTSSVGSAPMSAATPARRRSRCALARWPKACDARGVAEVVAQGLRRRRRRPPDATGVVALWSR